MPGGSRAWRHIPSALIVVGLILCCLAPPSGAEHTTSLRNGIQEVGFNDIENEGFNTDIMPWVSENGGVYAATGTWGTLTALGAPPEGDPCPSEDDVPTAPDNSGVKIVEATDPAEPTIVARVGTING